MVHRKISADRIFDGFKFLPEGSVLVLNEGNEVEDIIDKKEAGENVEVYQGILTPGFINSHCHLELSHMKGVIPPRTGLVDFLISVVTKRAKEDERLILEKIAEAEQELYENGVVGVGDIANTLHAIPIKSKSLLHWHNFIEVLNLFDKTITERLTHNQAILEAHKQLAGNSVLTPHAPYTVSAATYQAINAQTNNAVISIHNQETRGEDELFKEGKGDFLRLYQTLGIGNSPFPVSGKGSLQTYLPYFTNRQTLILVHNTFTTAEDIIYAQQHAQKHQLNLVYCLCPNANWYIEQALPPIDLLVEKNCTLVLGTDSYSSNWQLSIAQEVKTIKDYFPSLPLEQILQWATSNGANTFGWNKLGSFERGKQPGVVLLETFGSTEKITGLAKRIV